jgi:hypothetical protein
MLVYQRVFQGRYYVPPTDTAMAMGQWQGNQWNISRSILNF